MMVIVKHVLKWKYPKILLERDSNIAGFKIADSDVSYEGKKKGREFHTDYEKLSYEGKQRLLNDLEVRRDLKRDLKIN